MQQWEYCELLCWFDGESVANCSSYYTVTLLQPEGNGKIITEASFNADLNTDPYDQRDFAFEESRIIAQLGLEGWELIYERFDFGGPDDPEDYAKEFPDKPYFLMYMYFFKRPKPPE